MTWYQGLLNSIDEQAMKWANGDSARMPLLVSFLLISVTLVTLELSGPESISEYIRSQKGLNENLVLLLSPYLHSSFEHLANNLFFLIPLAVSYNRHRSGLAFISSVYLVGILSNIIGPLVFVLIGEPSGLSVGISGVTHALSSRETLYYVADNVSTKADFVFFFLSASFVIWNAFIIVSGSTPEGASISGHLTGLLLGIPWALVEIFGYNN